MRVSIPYLLTAKLLELIGLVSAIFLFLVISNLLGVVSIALALKVDGSGSFWATMADLPEIVSWEFVFIGLIGWFIAIVAVLATIIELILTIPFVPQIGLTLLSSVILAIIYSTVKSWFIFNIKNLE